MKFLRQALSIRAIFCFRFKTLISRWINSDRVDHKYLLMEISVIFVLPLTGKRWGITKNESFSNLGNGKYQMPFAGEIYTYGVKNRLIRYLWMLKFNEISIINFPRICKSMKYFSVLSKKIVDTFWNLSLSKNKQQISI